MQTTPTHYTKVKTVNSTTEFIKNRMGNSAHIDEIELEALAELMDHPIEHVIHEINMFAFLEAKEATNTCQWLGKLESCYEPSKYYKDTETNSHVHEIYTIAYVSGLFRGSQLNWAALTKEAYAIYLSV